MSTMTDIKSKIKLALRWALLLSMLLTVVFIFANSLKSKEESSEQSSAFGDFIAEIIPPDSDLGKFIEEYLRKIAHFTEYGLLGIELALYICFYTKQRIRLALASLPLSFFIGFIDESLQYISDRGPSISDVWIDAGGFLLFSALVYAIYVLVYLVVTRLRARCGVKNINGENNG